MIEPARKRNKVSISEDDIAAVLQRYPATTVLALLKEVARFSDAKLDWKELVKNTETGISNAREYQMLWRHLAYRQDLVDEFEDRAEPLDDDSDLEYELAASPLVSHEASVEALACVKVLMECGSSDPGNPGCTMVEAPLTINIPNGHSSNAPSENSKNPCLMQGINITVPICVQKQPIPALSSMEGVDACGTAGGNMPPRRKRKPWTEAEDVELIAAVQKYGEGNWANILKKDYKGDRTASQLSQRWAIIRKKNGNVNVGGSSALSTPHLSEAQLATRNANYAVNLALDPPVKNITSSSSVVPGGTGVNATPSNSVRPKSEVDRSMQAGLQSQQAGKGSNATSRNSVRLPNADTSCKVQAIQQSQQAGTGSNSKSSNSASPSAEASSSLQATPQSQQAGTGLKAASNNSVHPPNAEASSIAQQGSVLSKSSPMGTLGLSPKSRIITKKPLPKSVYSSDSKVTATAVAAGARIATKSVADSVIKAAKNVHIMPTGGGSLMKPSTSSAATSHLPGHPTVHYIRTGRAATTTSAPTRTATSAIQRSSSISSTLPNLSSKQTNGAPQQDLKTAEEVKVSQMNNGRKEQVQVDGASVADSSSKNEPKEQARRDGACVADSSSNNAPKEQARKDGACVAETLINNVPEEQVQKDGACVTGAPSKNVAEERVLQDGAPGKNVPEEQVQKGNACVADAPSKNVGEERVQKDGACVADAQSKNVAEEQVQKHGACVVDAPISEVEEDKAASSKQARFKEIVAEDLLNSKTTVINEAAAVAKKAEESHYSSQNNNKTQVSQDSNLNKNQTQVSQDSSQNKNKIEVSQDSSQNKNKIEESEDSSQNKNKIEESEDSSQNKNKIEVCQDAN